MNTSRAGQTGETQDTSWMFPAFQPSASRLFDCVVRGLCPARQTQRPTKSGVWADDEIPSLPAVRWGLGQQLARATSMGGRSAPRSIQLHKTTRTLHPKHRASKGRTQVINLHSGSQTQRNRLNNKTICVKYFQSIHAVYPKIPRTTTLHPQTRSASASWQPEPHMGFSRASLAPGARPRWHTRPAR